MTTSEEAPAPRGARWRQAMVWLGHLYGRISTPCLLSLFGFSVAELWTPEGGIRNQLSNIALAAAIVYVGGSMLRDRYHERIPCRACLNDAPWLDPQGEAEKYARQLRWWHNPWRTKALLTLLGGLGVAMLLGWLLTGPHRLLPLPLWAGAGIATVLYLALSVGMLLASNAGNHHKRLRPWCPGCRHGGRGPRARITPQPSPEPANA